MAENSQIKKYDLEERTFLFAKNVRLLVKKSSKNIANIEDGKQLVRSSGSAGANYIEANEALSKKDFLMRIKICRKESKESVFWLKLLDDNNDTIFNGDRLALLDEANQLMMIFAAIMRKSQ